MDNIYRDIGARTGGNIYIGVVGPVRTGKSTLVKRVMEQLVIPNIEDPYRRERARDELPQSGSGRTIMTSEPKFVPEEAVEISPDTVTKLRVRMIDSVGYMVDGAVGAEEDGQPRMVTTPWYEYEIPMTQAAELGTQKVMQEHCSMGLVVTTDGSITEIPRQDYAASEGRAIRDMQATGKPFVVIINSRNPGGEAAAAVKEQLKRDYHVDAMIADCQALDMAGICDLLRRVLYAFPMQELRVFMPRWVDALEDDHPVKTSLYETLLKGAEQIGSLAAAEEGLAALRQLDYITDFNIRQIDPASGVISCGLMFPESLFYQILTDRAGMEIRGDAQLLQLLTELSRIKREYNQIADALNAVKMTGYGVVMPAAEDMKLEKPEIVRKGGAFGVKLKAGAPSIHMIRVDIDTEISPMVGNEAQSRDLMSHLDTEDPQKLWQSNIFGKSVYDMIQEGLNAKLIRMPEDVRGKFRGTLTKIVNDGANGLICLIL